MEQSQRFKYKLELYEKALKGFNISLNIDVLGFSEEIIDTIKNGRIQKFEYCTELTWKAIKIFYTNIMALMQSHLGIQLRNFFLLEQLKRVTTNY